jgi:hypothetical protein
VKPPGRFPLTILVGLAACTWLAVAVVLYDATPELAFFKPLSIVAGVVATILALFDRLIWRIPYLDLVHGVPNLNGTWKGELRSMWVAPDTGQPPPPKVVYLVVRQTYSSATVRMLTDESSSLSIAASLVPETDGSLLLTYLYRNEPKLSVQDKSRLHYGGVKLRLVGKNDRLSGEYWTHRESKGEMDFERVSRQSVLDFGSAKALSAEASAGQ